jgi:hypothetical protein
MKTEMCASARCCACPGEPAPHNDEYCAFICLSIIPFLVFFGIGIGYLLCSLNLDSYQGELVGYVVYQPDSDNSDDGTISLGEKFEYHPGNHNASRFCFISREGNYDSVEDANTAGEAIAFGSFRKIWISLDDPKDCIDYPIHYTNYNIGVACICIAAALCLPCAYFILRACQSWYCIGYTSSSMQAVNSRDEEIEIVELDAGLK